MKTGLRRHLTPGNAVAMAALMVALGGTGVAASTLANGSVTSAKIANSAVKSAKIANGSVTSAKIANGSVKSGKIANSAVTSAKIAAGAVTASQIAPATLAAMQGRIGPAGPAGPPGPPGPSETYTGFNPSGSLTGGQQLVVGLSLPAGNYLFQANLILTNTDATAVDAECQIGASLVPVVDAATTSLDAAGGLDTQTVTLAGTAALTVPGIANLAQVTCSAPGVNFEDADIMATRVGTLH